MKLFILAPDLAERGPVWVNMLWPQVHVVSQCYDTVLLPLPARPAQPGPKWRQALSEVQLMARTRAALVERVRTERDTDGPNVLLVWANEGRALRWSRVLDPVWDMFDARVVIVNDALQHWQVKAHWLTRFDRALFTCADLAADFRAAFGIETRHSPGHTDVLGLHGTGAFRPIDMILVGRRIRAQHNPLYHHYTRPGSDRLFLDFVTRTKTLMSHEEEFRLLMSTYGRSKIAFCYEAGNVDRYDGKSPLLARWVHAWASGCTVVGARPTGTGTQALMDWDESTLQLPTEFDESVAFLTELLDDQAGLERRRKRNVIEALLRHDTRHRLHDLVTDLDLPVSRQLTEGLSALQMRADALRAL